MINWKSGYRHYNEYMDFAFWVLLIAYVRGWLRLAGVPGQYLLDLWRPLNIGLGVFFLLTQLGLIALIVLRRLRDEYAEQLWQKSAASFVKLLPLFPLIWLVGFFIFADQSGWLNSLRANPQVAILPDHLRLPNSSHSIGIYQFEGLNFVVLKLTQYFPLLFAALYKWHRWHDER